MEKLSLKEIAAALNTDVGADTDILDVCIDTRKITKGALFICIRGERFDAHDFAAQAKEKGASALVVDHRLDVDIPQLVVENTAKALLDLSSYYRSKFNIPIVALTGSVGKTTTKEFTYLVVNSEYNTVKTLGNLNNEIGLPQMLFRLDNTTQAAVIEMGMNHFDEIHRLSTATKPTIALITNIGVSHIENLGSRQGILKAKLEILDGLAKGSVLILNGDNDLLKTVKNDDYKIVFYGIENGEFKASDITEEKDKTSFVVNYFGSSQRIIIPTIGIHNVYNALAAFAVGYYLGIDSQKCVDALSEYQPEGMRQKSVICGGIKCIEDCYNASPDSMRAGITTLANTQGKRKIAVLSDMLELGEYSDAAHTEVGKMAAELGIDYLFSFGEASKNIVSAAKKEGLANAFHFETKDELAEKLLDIIEEGDTILFKASRGMKLEDVIHILYDRWGK